MTNYNFNGKNYFYTIFEFGNKGYILKEKYLPPAFEEQERDEFFNLAERIGEKLITQTENEVLEEMGYLHSYTIKTHKAEIILHSQGICTVISRSKDKERKNIMYLLLTIEKMKNFSKIPRHNSSRETLFFENIKNEFNEDLSAEIFLN